MPLQSLNAAGGKRRLQCVWPVQCCPVDCTTILVAVDKRPLPIRASPRLRPRRPATTSKIRNLLRFAALLERDERRFSMRHLRYSTMLVLLLIAVCARRTAAAQDDFD